MSFANVHRRVAATVVVICLLLTGQHRLVSADDTKPAKVNPAGANAADHSDTAHRFSIQHASQTALAPTHIALVIPLSSSASDSQDAIEGLRRRRLVIERAAAEMGCDQAHIHSAFYSAGPESQSVSSIALRARNGVTSEPKTIARCIMLILDELDDRALDQESNLVEGQQQLQNLLQVLPPEDLVESSSSSRSVIYSPSSSQISHPIALFAANVTTQKRLAMVQQAMKAAEQRARELAGLNQSDHRISLSESMINSYSSTRRDMVSLERLISTFYPDMIFSMYPDQIVFHTRIMASISPPNQPPSQ
ncbi:hypothetical protein [Crateriforma conspicua]|uniref:Secreted protein n=1 Tax=Crateriforma conspicua TaxID=2527996 RepID=A0A5C5Y944_9PLAN|nr:hypothetical protein [Crateriforma conspicua]TWT72197.1 hypothetical protein Pan14r_45150 [Crateriforma conspicua]